MSKLVLAAAAATAAVCLAGPALAASGLDRESPTVAVSIKGVNFNDPAQARAFYTKLQSAARYVCESDPNHLAVANNLDCVRRNMADAVQQLNAPRLTALLDKTYGSGERATAFAADAR